MTMLRSLSWSQTEERKRRSRGSGEVQTRQVQVSKGTPWDVPVPKKVKSIRFDSGRRVRWRISFTGFRRGKRTRFCLPSLHLLLWLTSHVKAITDSKLSCS